MTRTILAVMVVAGCVGIAAIPCDRANTARGVFLILAAGIAASCATLLATARRTDR